MAKFELVTAGILKDKIAAQKDTINATTYVATGDIDSAMTDIMKIKADEKLPDSIVEFSVQIDKDPERNYSRPYKFDVDKVKITGKNSAKTSQLVTLRDDYYKLNAQPVLDWTKTRDSMPIMYGDIYDRLESRDFPMTINYKQLYKPFVTWKELKDNEAVPMGGTLGGDLGSFELKLYGAGFKRSKISKLYDMNLTNAQIIESNRISHNAFLNDMYLSPILKYDYTADFAGKGAGKDWQGASVVTPADTTSGVTDFELWYKTAKAGFTAFQERRMPKAFAPRDVDAKVGQRMDNGVLLMHWRDAMSLMTVINGLPTLEAKKYPPLSGVAKIVVYEGDYVEQSEGCAPLEYDGVPKGKSYLVYPKKGFKEVIKIPETMLTGVGSIDTLEPDQMAWFDVRGIVAQPQYYVQVITWPTNKDL